MDIQSEKYYLIQQIIQLQDSTLIKKIRDFLKKETVNDDWYYTLSSSQKESIFKSLQDLENGNVVAHKEVLSSVKSKITALKQI